MADIAQKTEARRDLTLKTAAQLKPLPVGAPAPHVLAALTPEPAAAPAGSETPSPARIQAMAASLPRPLAAHVAAVVAAVQAKPEAPGSRPIAEHVKTAIKPSTSPAQAKAGTESRPLAAHVSLAVRPGGEETDPAATVAAHVLQRATASAFHGGTRLEGPSGFAPSIRPGMPADRPDWLHRSLAIQRAARDPEVEAVRTWLTHGAGNKQSDIDSSGGESVWRVMAAKNVGRGNRKVIKSACAEIAPKGLEGIAEEAVTGAFVKAGNCMEHAAVAFFQAIASHSGKWIFLMSASIDHAFVLVGDSSTPSGDDIVIDTWQPSDNRKKLSESTWKKGSKVRAKYKADGEDYLGLIVAEVNSELDSDELEKEFTKAKKQFYSSGNPFKVYG